MQRQKIVYGKISDNWSMHDSPIIIQSAEILMLPSKCEIIFLPFKNGNFSNIAIAILDFSLLLSI